MTSARLLTEDRLQVAIGIVGDCSDAAFLVDRQGTIVAWNAAACELFGIVAWDASARNCASVVRGCSPAGVPICRAGCPLLSDAGRATRSTEMQVPCGRLGRSRPVNLQHVPIRDPQAGATIAVLHLVEPRPACSSAMVSS
jgi:PAS fold